jgi:hypothetical protein
VTIRIPRVLLLAVVALLLVAAGGVGGYALGRATRKARVVRAAASQANAQALWNARTGLAWQQYQAQFVTGYYQGCDQMFALSDVPVLKDNTGRVWTDDDCYKARPNIESTTPPTFPPSDPASAGFVNGENAGCKAIILKSNSDLTGTTVPGKPFTGSLDYCNEKFPQTF